tara:strand:- start:1335 stop:1733 length:399 start_codon:yes stop_codon:yes gene_type:complete
MECDMNNYEENLTLLDEERRAKALDAEEFLKKLKELKSQSYKELNDRIEARILRAYKEIQHGGDYSLEISLSDKLYDTFKSCQDEVERKWEEKGWELFVTSRKDGPMGNTLRFLRIKPTDELLKKYKIIFRK